MVVLAAAGFAAPNPANAGVEAAVADDVVAAVETGAAAVAASLGLPNEKAGAVAAGVVVVVPKTGAEVTAEVLDPNNPPETAGVTLEAAEVVVVTPPKENEGVAAGAAEVVAVIEEAVDAAEVGFKEPKDNVGLLDVDAKNDGAAWDGAAWAADFAESALTDAKRDEVAGALDAEVLPNPTAEAPDVPNGLGAAAAVVAEVTGVVESAALPKENDGVELVPNLGVAVVDPNKPPEAGVIAVEETVVAEEDEGAAKGDAELLIEAKREGVVADEEVAVVEPKAGADDEVLPKEN